MEKVVSIAQSKVLIAEATVLANARKRTSSWNQMFVSHGTAYLLVTKLV